MLSKLRLVALVCYSVGLPIFIYKFAITPLGTQPSTLLKLSFVLIAIGLFVCLFAGWRQFRTLRQPGLFLVGNIMLVVGTIGSFFQVGNFIFLPLWLFFFFGALIGAILASATAFLQNQY